MNARIQIRPIGGRFRARRSVGVGWKREAVEHDSERELSKNSCQDRVPRPLAPGGAALAGLCVVRSVTTLRLSSSK